MRRRIVELEKAVRELGGRECPLCQGWPWAVVYEEWEPDPDGPGYRRTGRRRVKDPDRVTDDLRCPRCGTPARKTILEVTRDWGWDDPAGGGTVGGESDGGEPINS